MSGRRTWLVLGTAAIVFALGLREAAPAWVMAQKREEAATRAVAEPATVLPGAAIKAVLVLRVCGEVRGVVVVDESAVHTFQPGDAVSQQALDGLAEAAEMQKQVPVGRLELARAGCVRT